MLNDNDKKLFFYQDPTLSPFLFRIQFLDKEGKILYNQVHSCAQFFYKAQRFPTCTQIRYSLQLTYEQEYDSFVRFLEWHFNPKTCMLGSRIAEQFELEFDDKGRPVSILLKDTSAISKDEFICFITMTRMGHQYGGSLLAWEKAVDAGASPELAFLICNAVKMSFHKDGKFHDTKYEMNSAYSGGNTLFQLQMYCPSEEVLLSHDFFPEGQSKKLTIFGVGMYQVNSRFIDSKKTLTFPNDFFDTGKPYSGVFERYNKNISHKLNNQKPLPSISCLVKKLQEIESNATKKKKVA